MNFSVGDHDFLVGIQVVEVLFECFPASRRKIEWSSRLVEDLYVDSMAVVEIVMALNESFGIELPGSGVAKWRTVADVCASVICARKLSNF